MNHIQWRANSSQSQGLGNYELNKANWGWSWKERWIAARPWESRVADISTKKDQTKQSGKTHKDKNSSTPKIPVSVKQSMANPKGTPRARKLSYSTTEKTEVNDGEQ